MRVTLLLAATLLLVGCEPRATSEDALREFGPMAPARLEELEAKAARAEQSRRELASIEVLNTRYFMEANGPVEFPWIEFTVRNGSGHTLSRLDLVATLASPDRAVPWEKTPIEHPIRGGLAWRVRHWKKLIGWWEDTPPGTQVTLKIERAYGADGSELFTAIREFSDEEAEELARMRRVLDDLQKQEAE